MDQATTFSQLSAAGEAYGEVLGENAARVFVMLATAAIGNTAGLAAKAGRLPGSAPAALAVEAQAGFQYAAVGSVQSAIELRRLARDASTPGTEIHRLLTQRK